MVNDYIFYNHSSTKMHFQKFVTTLIQDIGPPQTLIDHDSQGTLIYQIPNSDQSLLITFLKHNEIGLALSDDHNPIWHYIDDYDRIYGILEYYRLYHPKE